MLKFRELDYSKDIPSAVELINAWLDDDYSEALFKWKHLQNPFGESYGIVVEKDGEIIGLRMFMFWQFINCNVQNKIIAIRPVDTVVDKKYRGKGLFKRLNLQGLEKCHGKFDIIFNTPNENSLPGNIKMGAELIDNNPKLKVGVLNPFAKKSKIQATNLKSFDLEKNYGISGTMWQTNKSGKFLRWRYNAEMYSVVKYLDSLMVFSVKKIKFIKTMVIYELLGDSKGFETLINSTAGKLNIFLIYYANNKEFKFIDCLATSIRDRPNVVFTFDTENIQKKLNLSLGDLEAKL